MSSIHQVCKPYIVLYAHHASFVPSQAGSMCTVPRMVACNRDTLQTRNRKTEKTSGLGVTRRLRHLRLGACAAAEINREQQQRPPGLATATSRVHPGRLGRAWACICASAVLTACSLIGAIDVRVLASSVAAIGGSLFWFVYLRCTQPRGLLQARPGDVTLAVSNITGAGLGLFAARDLNEGFVLGNYPGVSRSLACACTHTISVAPGARCKWQEPPRDTICKPRHIQMDVLRVQMYLSSECLSFAEKSGNTLKKKLSPQKNRVDPLRIRTAISLQAQLFGLAFSEFFACCLQVFQSAQVSDYGDKIKDSESKNWEN